MDVKYMASGPFRLQRAGWRQMRAEMGDQRFLFQTEESSGTGIEITGVLRGKAQPDKNTTKRKRKSTSAG